MRSRVLTGVLALALALLAGGCSPDGDDPDATTLRVYAAASLAGPFEQLAEEFEADHDGVEVQLNLAGSSDLAAQILEGAPADVFASADTATMRRLLNELLVAEEPQPFATNTLRIAVPPGNPAGVATFADLADPDLQLVVCAPEVPCGAAATEAAEAAGVTLAPVSEEQSVTDVLAKVTSGEADAGLVYVTDVLAAGHHVEGIDFQESEESVNHYPIAPVADSARARLAEEFVALVLGERGQAILADAGFGPPRPGFDPSPGRTDAP
ncbi:molybdate ABC transporter substrate-binding protein [Nocardioides campestrisoli]|uniref:molybdate ABC transporter substrate-binding protein n=1 Tax=Nocardioides campestrisoli TaxID=2736757 RepID=UPI00163DB485|nr:molybdate ABC transporter substrate-binding protein [Nocardioides campestrisoli]